ncbi:hypothetical protein F2Q69_00013324 [Brassica cretica]|uniref:Uncharacterized protein n=1 Tax=Brassica cretica TaxID=69181 RepID=A0A8S9QZF3_BRACR|nr:hypothetical protein F2Q69_00013324 [Brassica cretica]
MKPQTTSRRINDPRIIAACHCGAEYETEYLASIETHTATLIDSAHQISTDIQRKNRSTVVPRNGKTIATIPLWQHTTCIQRSMMKIMRNNENGSTSIDTQPHQPSHLQASTDIAYYPSIDTNVDANQDGDYSIGSWADDRHHESYTVDTAYHDQGADELHEGFTYEELLNMQRCKKTDQKRAVAAWGRTHFSHSIDRAIPPSIDINPSTLIDINHTTRSTAVQYQKPLDPNGYAKAIDGRTLHVSREDIADILQTANGADNLFMQQHTITEHQQKVTKELYDTAGGIDKSFKQRSRHPTQPSFDVDISTSVDRRPEFGRRAFDLFEHASSFTQTKLVPEIYTKDEINEMFYGISGEQEKNKEDFQMKLDGVYYPLNDSIDIPWN